MHAYAHAWEKPSARAWEKAFGARAPTPCDKNNAKASELAARQRVLFCEKMNLDP
jgi:hypothetical protein